MTAQWQEKTVVGLKVRHRPGSPEKCLVMLHGIGSNARSFDRLANHLPQEISLISWNAPGYGGSEPIGTPHPQVSDFALRLLELTHALDLQQFTLVGHSLGTLIATEFAAVHPQFVNSLILFAAAQGYGTKPGAALPEKANTRLNHLADLGTQAFAESRAPKLMYHPDSRPDVRDGAIRDMAAIDPAGYRQAVHMLSGGNLSQRAHDVRLPSLVLVGAQDRITPPEQSRAVHTALTTASPEMLHSYDEIDHAGHILHQEKPQEIADHIMRFRGWDTTAMTKVAG